VAIFHKDERKKENEEEEEEEREEGSLDLECSRNFFTH